MTITTKLASAALAALVLTTTFAQAGGISASYDPKIMRIAPVAACTLAGGEFPSSIFIINKGAVTLKAGAKVQWNVPFANKKGVYTLVADLSKNQSVYVANAIPGSVEAGHDCIAKAL